MEGIEEIVQEGFTAVFNSDNPQLKVIVLLDKYGLTKEGDGLYKRIQINGLDSEIPTTDYNLGSLAEVLTQIVRGRMRVASPKECEEISDRVLNTEGKLFQKVRNYFFRDGIPTLHGDLPQSIKEKYGMK